jgi:ring-1,2-phenylacetyl-CoA epoxidase subunit PaaD
MNEQTAWQILDTVTDPEIPVVSLVEMGIIQKVEVRDGEVYVAMTPTFSGCPALHVMKDDIRAAFVAHGIATEDIVVQTVLEPAWTSERISEAGRQKLKSIGLAPPERVPSNGGIIAITDILLNGIECPFCNSHNTEMESPFGPTMCRSLYYCHDCQQPFEKFKAL